MKEENITGLTDNSTLFRATPKHFPFTGAWRWSAAGILKQVMDMRFKKAHHLSSLLLNRPHFYDGRFRKIRKRHG